MIATHFVENRATAFGLAQFRRFAIHTGMFDKDAFLAAVLERAGSQAAICRALDLPSSRVAELFRDESSEKKPRGLKIDEAIKLAEEFGVPLHGPTINAEILKPILQVCLRYPPRNGWTDRAVERLAEELEYGIGLLRSGGPSQPSQDAIDVAARAIADRLRDKPGPEAT